MTFSDDFVPVEDAEELEGPSYPVVFGVELTPKVQGISLAVLGVGGAIFLFTRLVSPVQETVTEIEQRIEEKEDTLANQAESLRQIEEVQAELDRVLAQREGIYSLLGDPNSFDTLLLDTNQQIEKSNAAIAGAIAGNLSQAQSAELASLGFNNTEINRIFQEIADDPVVQRSLFTSELSSFDPLGLPSIVGEEYGEPLSGQLERQIVEVSFSGLFNQTQSILYNLERLEPLRIIRDFNQEASSIDGDITEEEANRLGIRPLETSFTMEVLVPLGDPSVPPVPAEPEAEEGEEGEEGEDDEATEVSDDG